jgi:hypothetical protein
VDEIIIYAGLRLRRHWHLAVRALYAGRSAWRPAATEPDIDPDRVKVTRTVRIVRRAIGPAAFPPEQREHVLAAVRADITRKQDLNPKRRYRTYPRVVKRARHNSYRVKRPGDEGTRHSQPPTIELANLSRAA